MDSISAITPANNVQLKIAASAYKMSNASTATVDTSSMSSSPNATLANKTAFYAELRTCAISVPEAIFFTKPPSKVNTVSYVRN